MPEYRLGRQRIDHNSGQAKIEMHGILTEQEYQDIKNALSKIEELHSVRRLRDFVIANDHELLEMLSLSVNQLVSKSSHWMGVKRKDIEKVFLDTNRLLLNYLTAVKTFIDHSTTFLNHKFGDESEEFLGFKIMLSAFYDHSFAYRFLTKLRNYAQHVDLPLDNIQFNTKKNEELNTLEGNLIIEFNRDRLLNSFQKWGSVKKDLEAMQANFFFTPLLFQMTQIIGEIERNIELIFKNELLASANLIAGHIDELWEGDWEVFVAADFLTPDEGELSKINQDDIPLDTLDFILTSLA